MFEQSYNSQNTSFPIFPFRKWLEHFRYCNESNYLNHPIIRTPPFLGKMIDYCIPSIRAPTFEIIITISEHVHLAELNQVSLNIYKT